MDLEEIKKRKLMEMQERRQEEMKIREQIDQLETLAKSKLTKKAQERYTNLRIAHPEKAIQAAALVVQTDQETIDDEQFKKLLQLMEAEKKQTKIRRA